MADGSDTTLILAETPDPGLLHQGVRGPSTRARSRSSSTSAGAVHASCWWAMTANGLGRTWSRPSIEVARGACEQAGVTVENGWERELVELMRRATTCGGRWPGASWPADPSSVRSTNPSCNLCGVNSSLPVGDATRASARVALVTCRDLPGLDPRRSAAAARTARRARHRAQAAVWDDTDVDWDAYDLVVIRSPWDYFYLPA